MGCCFSCSADDAQPIPISAPPPPQSSISMAAVEEEEEKVKEVVVVVSQTEIIPSPPKLEMKDHIIKQLLLNNNIPVKAASTSPLKQRRPFRRTHSFSGDLTAVAAPSPNQTQLPSRSHRHSGSYKIVQSRSLKDSGDTSGRRLAASSAISQRSSSMRRTTQLSPMKGRISSSNKKRVENGYTKELKTAKRKNGSADTPSVSLECFIFL